MIKAIDRQFVASLAGAALAALLVAGPCAAASPPPAGAGASGSGDSGAAPKPMGTFKDWTAYSMQGNNHLVCFVVSEPKSSYLSDPKAQRGDPFFLITRWTADQALQPSIIIGYPQASDSKTKIKIGNDSFEMFVDGDGAWMESADGDKKLTEAMKKGAIMTVTGVSSHGTKSTDHYSLAGLTAALDKISKDCK